MKKLLAVSGGIDSVVMLHLFRNDPKAVVLHFDHGIRSSSAKDCEFVGALAKKYGLPFMYERARLGESCSEEKARAARYEFFKSQLESGEDKIYTAHHAGDLLESTIINLLRGTGWRGLAPLRDSRLERPLLGWSKADIYRYATENRLSFRLDQSNSDNKYLRNRIREALLSCSSAQKEKMLELARAQRGIADEFDSLLNTLIVPSSQYPRDIFEKIDEDLSIELLRQILKPKLGLTRPQLRRALYAVKTFESGKRFSLAKDCFLLVRRHYFVIENNRG